jgi:hypothetical protein
VPFIAHRQYELPSQTKQVCVGLTAPSACFYKCSSGCDTSISGKQNLTRESVSLCRRCRSKVYVTSTNAGRTVANETYDPKAVFDFVVERFEPWQGKRRSQPTKQLWFNDRKDISNAIAIAI